MSKDKKVKDVLAPRPSKVTKSSSKTKKKPEPKAAYKSAERITASDDEDMDIISDAPSQISGHAITADGESSGDDDQGDESEPNDAIETSTTSKAIPKQIKRPAGPDTTAIDGVSKNRNAKSTPIAKPAKKAKESTSKPTQATSSTAAPTSNGRIDTEISEESLRPTQRYEPPPNFKSVKEESIAEAADMFRARNMKDKEIWYISAPASLPITALKEVALEKFAKQQAIMSHEGEHYALVSDPAAVHSTRVLLPQEKSGYKVVATPVKHVLQFQQVLNVQATSSKGRPKTVAQVLLDTDVPTKPSKRPQPVGLKMKWRPSGFGDGYLGAIGSSDEEGEELPEVSTLHVQSKAVDSTIVPPESEKKKKKKEKHKSHEIVSAQEAAEANATYVQEATVAIDADQETAPPEAQAPEGKKKKKKDKKGIEIATGPEPIAEPENGEPIVVEDDDGSKDVSEKKKQKKKKKRKHGDEVDEVETRAANGLEQLTIDLEEVLDKNKKKKKKKGQDAMEV